MRLPNINKKQLCWVLPKGWLLHIFFPLTNPNSYLVRCSETGLFAGVDWKLLGFRIVLRRVNHIPHRKLNMVVDRYDAAKEAFEIEWAVLRGEARQERRKEEVCACCGDLWPDLFSVPDKEWKHYIQMDMQDKVICRKCYDRIKYLIDTKEEK